MNFQWFNYAEWAIATIALFAWFMMIANKDRAAYQPKGGPTLTLMVSIMTGLAGFTQDWATQTLLAGGAFALFVWGITASSDSIAWCDRHARQILAGLGSLIWIQAMVIAIAYPGLDTRKLSILLILVGTGFWLPLFLRSILGVGQSASAIAPIPAPPTVPSVAEPSDIRKASQL